MEDYLNIAIYVFEFCARSKSLNTQDFFSHWLTRFIYDELDQRGKEDFTYSGCDYSDFRSDDIASIKDNGVEPFGRHFYRLYSKAVEIIKEANYNIDDPSIERNIMELKEF